jgi:hypothetical protein
VARRWLAELAKREQRRAHSLRSSSSPPRARRTTQRRQTRDREPAADAMRRIPQTQTLLLPLLALLQPLLAQPLSHKQDCVALGRPRYDAICSARGVQHYTPVISDDFVVACIMIMFLLLFCCAPRRRRRARAATATLRARAPLPPPRRRPPPRRARLRPPLRRAPPVRVAHPRRPCAGLPPPPLSHACALASRPQSASSELGPAEHAAPAPRLVATVRSGHANFVGYSNICTLSTTARA